MLKNARLNTKISVCFSLLLAFITAVACVVLAEFYRDSSLRQSGLLLQTVGDAAVQQLEMTFDEMDRISARLFFSFGNFRSHEGRRRFHRPVGVFRGALLYAGHCAQPDLFYRQHEQQRHHRQSV